MRSHGSGTPDGKGVEASKKRQRVVSQPRASIQVTFRRVEPTEALHKYADRKLQRLVRFLKKDADIHLILAVDKHRQWGEVTLKCGALETKAAHDEERDLYAVIDKLASKLKRQVKEDLKRICEGRKRALKAPEALELVPTLSYQSR